MLPLFNDRLCGNRADLKTAWFFKEAWKTRIKDDELCEAIEEVKKGQADELGGSMFKKRLNKNMHRSIVLAKGPRQGWLILDLCVLICQ